MKYLNTKFLMIIFFFVGFSIPLSSNAQDGSLDLSFDTDGKVITPIGISVDNGRAVALQSDGKIVAVGKSNNGTNDNIAVVRYNTNGSLDTTFDGDGKVSTPEGSGIDFANTIAIQSNGRIVVAGSSFNGTDNDFGLVRYNTTFTGIEKSSNEFSDFSVYPNPANEFIAVKISTCLLGSSYSILDALGRRLFTGQMKTETTIIDLKELSAGMYFFQVEGQNKTACKIIKQ